MFTWRYVFVLIMMIIFSSFIIGRIIHLNSEESSLKAAVALMSRNLMSTKPLNEQIRNLENMASNIEDYKLSDIQKQLATTSRLIALSEREIAAQYQAWSLVSEKFGDDKKAFFELKAQLEQTKQMHDEQIIRLKKIIELAERPPFYVRLMDILISFTFGVIASIFANYVYSKYFDRKILKDAL